jgi:hypothetical protein
MAEYLYCTKPPISGCILVHEADFAKPLVDLGKVCCCVLAVAAALLDRALLCSDGADWRRAPVAVLLLVQSRAFRLRSQLIVCVVACDVRSR